MKVGARQTRGSVEVTGDANKIDTYFADHDEEREEIVGGTQKSKYPTRP